MNIRELMTTAPVIPVIVIDDLKSAVPLAKALVQGGLPVLEITLRSDAAVEAIQLIAEEVPGAIVGAGTVNSESQMHQVQTAGARFAVSPGLTPALANCATELGLPYLPGIMTPCEILMAMENNLDALKFFPAGNAGGAKFLKALAGPFPDIVFCPTGGINAGNKQDYLSLENVLCVGGSWVAPADLVARGQWDEITKLATEASSAS